MGKELFRVVTRGAVWFCAILESFPNPPPPLTSTFLVRLLANMKITIKTLQQKIFYVRGP